ncbi:MAG: hypothetical protein ACXAC8_15990 [Candidatus Hodarchaeales archaeon]|jgi:hypothetical protein
MFPEAELSKIVEAFINKEENLGEQRGSSGHLSYISYRLDKVGKPKKIRSGVWEINFTYSLLVETEFSYYPDNPPHEYKHKGTITINEDGKILETP